MRVTVFVCQQLRDLRHHRHHRHHRRSAPQALRLVSFSPPINLIKNLIKLGKCYTWTFPNGEKFGYNAHGWYTASKESRHQQFGKFKLCKDEKCSPGPINPGEGFSAKDLHGNANGQSMNPHFSVLALTVV